MLSRGCTKILKCVSELSRGTRIRFLHSAAFQTNWNLNQRLDNPPPFLYLAVRYLHHAIGCRDPFPLLSVRELTELERCPRAAYVEEQSVVGFIVCRRGEKPSGFAGKPLD